MKVSEKVTKTEALLLAMTLVFLLLTGAIFVLRSRSGGAEYVVRNETMRAAAEETPPASVLEEEPPVPSAENPLNINMADAAALDTLPRGMNGELRQLLFFYVGAGKRGQGWGRRLFQYALHQLPEMGASGLYISSIPNKNTVDFYLAQGCRLADKPDPALFALEPEDIHLVCDRL